MKLKEWLNANGMTQAAFAVKILVSEPLVSFLINDKRYPTRKTLKRIIEATNGQVTAADFNDDL